MRLMRIRPERFADIFAGQTLQTEIDAKFSDCVNSIRYRAEGLLCLVYHHSDS